MYLWGRDLWIESFAKKGVEVTIPTAAQKAEWVKAIKGPMEQWVRGKIGDEWVDKVSAASKKAEKELYGD
jgi:TRAP-type C4-dicarboxylate transport system substrate-binding protein